MNVIIVPGYGDRRGYIDIATRNWLKKYGLSPDIYVFGWNGDAESYHSKWADFCSHIENLEETVVVGISAGASVAIKALQTYPDRVAKVITICGPVHSRYIDHKILHEKYPLLEVSLKNIDVSQIESSKVMTFRPLYDDVVQIAAMKIDDARDVRMNTIFHAVSIAWAIFTKGRTIAKFINE